MADDIDMVFEEGASTGDSTVEEEDEESCDSAVGMGFMSPQERAASMRLERELRQLRFQNPGRALEEPDNENRAVRRTRRSVVAKNYRETAVDYGGPVSTLYDENGLIDCKDICDCLEPSCPGCHSPCSKCQSPKCGIECRCYRRWTYDYVVTQGDGVPKRVNPYGQEQASDHQDA